MGVVGFAIIGLLFYAYVEARWRKVKQLSFRCSPNIYFCKQEFFLLEF